MGSKTFQQCGCEPAPSPTLPISEMGTVPCVRILGNKSQKQSLMELLKDF